MCVAPDCQLERCIRISSYREGLTISCLVVFVGECVGRSITRRLLPQSVQIPKAITECLIELQRRIALGTETTKHENQLVTSRRIFLNVPTIRHQQQSQVQQAVVLPTLIVLRVASGSVCKKERVDVVWTRDGLLVGETV